MVWLSLYIALSSIIVSFFIFNPVMYKAILGYAGLTRTTDRSCTAHVLLTESEPHFQCIGISLPPFDRPGKAVLPTATSCDPISHGPNAVTRRSEKEMMVFRRMQLHCATGLPRGLGASVRCHFRIYAEELTTGLCVLLACLRYVLLYGRNNCGSWWQEV